MISIKQYKCQGNPRNTRCLHAFRHSIGWDTVTAGLLTWLVKSLGIKVTHLQWFIPHRQARDIGLQRIAWILKLDHILCHWTVRISLVDRRESSLHLWELTQNILKLWGRNFQERFDQPRHCNWNCRSDMTRDQLAWDILGLSKYVATEEPKTPWPILSKCFMHTLWCWTMLNVSF